MILNFLFYPSSSNAQGHRLQLARTSEAFLSPIYFPRVAQRLKISGMYTENGTTYLEYLGSFLPPANPKNNVTTTSYPDVDDDYQYRDFAKAYKRIFNIQISDLTEIVVRQYETFDSQWAATTSYYGEENIDTKVTATTTEDMSQTITSRDKEILSKSEHLDEIRGPSSDSHYTYASSHVDASGNERPRLGRCHTLSEMTSKNEDLHESVSTETAFEKSDDYRLAV